MYMNMAIYGNGDVRVRESFRLDRELAVHVALLADAFYVSHSDIVNTAISRFFTYEYNDISSDIEMYLDGGSAEFPVYWKES